MILLCFFFLNFFTGWNLCVKSTWKVGCDGRDCWLFRKPCLAGYIFQFASCFILSI